jgi:hypothetical protein
MFMEFDYAGQSAIGYRLSAYPLLPLLFRNPSDQACRNFTRVSLLRSGVTSSSAMQGMPRSSTTNPLKHDIEALADEPRIGALEGSGLAMPIARSRAAKRRCHVPEIGELYAG